MTAVDAVDLGPEPVSPAPDPDPRAPDLVLPPGSWDAHCHVFGPPERFPYAEDAAFRPPAAGVEVLQHLHRTMGLSRALVVQSACHGTDHRALLDTLARSDGAYRGVALLSPSVSDDEVDALDEAGVRGVRLNFLPHLGGAPAPEVMEHALDVVRRHGWHLEVHVAGTGLVDQEQLLASLDVPVVIDHLGRFDIADPEPSVAAALRLLEAGHVWMKVSGVDRLSAQPPPFADAVEVARTLVREAPTRTLWGTDFPHPNSSGWLPSDAARVELLSEITSGPESLERLLVTNPEELLSR